MELTNTGDELALLRQLAEKHYPYMPVEQGDYGDEPRYKKNKAKIDRLRKGFIAGAKAMQELEDERIEKPK